jgi:hypothetical protein
MHGTKELSGFGFATFCASLAFFVVPGPTTPMPIARGELSLRIVLPCALGHLQDALVHSKAEQDPKRRKRAKEAVGSSLHLIAGSHRWQPSHEDAEAVNRPPPTPRIIDRKGLDS